MSLTPSDSRADDGSSVLRTSPSLIEGIRDDDGAAWDRMVALYAPLVARWCRGQRLNEADAADVFQEVFLAVAAHVGRFQRVRRGDTFRGWLRTITRNKIHDLHRRRLRRPQGVGGSEAQRRINQLAAAGGSEAGESERAGAPPLDAPAADVNFVADAAPLDETSLADPAAERSLFRRGLELIRREFEHRTWQAFWRTAVDGRAAADVAAELGMSPGAVRVAKSRVLQRLRSELGDLGGSAPRGDEPK
jgi:RNA polymerase sigma-70 factor (ECF subfamily)